jgi:RNA polymerase sigma-54 factor
VKPSLQVRLSQHLALTPQLQQSIRLLQLSTLELHQEVGQMLEANPFLELEDDAPPAFEASLAAASALSPGPGAERDDTDGRLGDDEPGGLDAAGLGTPEREDWANGTEGDDFDGIGELPAAAAAAAAAGGDDEHDAPERAGAGPTLAEHLRSQLLGMRLAPEDAAAVGVLIDSLDDDGYLADAPEDLARALAGDDEAAAEELQARLRCALAWLQSLEPCGVGARDLGECLQLQLRALPASPARAVALAICAQHLELLARRDLRRLAALTGADEALVRAAQALILRCEPKPGRAFAPTTAQVVVPDVVVVRSGRGWKCVLNPEVLPRLRINDHYAQALRGQRNGSALSGRLQEARWFVRNIQQRFETILRVSSAIVERQKSFFSHGELAMKPLVLREIADELGLHESTISRVTTAKYMATPQGTFELKFFFGSGLATEAGGSASSTAVRALLRQLVAAEDPCQPLSDSQLSQMLDEQGIKVARRTVAKYREELRIAPANLRRAL